MNTIKIKNKFQSSSYLLKHASIEKAFRIRGLSKRPIIIGGCGRSGTTLLLSILSCHPAILGIAPETVALCPDGYGEDGMYNKTPDLTVPLQVWKIYQYLIDEEIPIEAERWCEKTPRNVLYFDRILEYFGREARLIHIVRDGRDVVTSRHPGYPDRFWAPPDRWVQDVSAGLKFENHPQVLTIRYEDLLNDYEWVLRRVCGFINETFAPEFLDYPQSSTVHQHLAWSEGPRKISNKSIGRWQNPEFDGFIESFMRDSEVVKLLEHFDYL